MSVLAQLAGHLEPRPPFCGCCRTPPAATTAAAAAAATAQPPEPSHPPPTVDEAAARERLERHFLEPPDPSDWAARAARLRAGLRARMGLEPERPRTPLAPLIHGRVELDGYTVENVAIETFPGFYCTGNLYRPTPPPQQQPGGGDRRCAGVLCPHGHFGPKFIEANAEWGEAPTEGRATELSEFESLEDDAAVGGRFRRDMQLRCATLARLGAVVFAYDLIGWGDSQQLNHTDPRVLAYQSWNGTRAVDFLCSLPEVDPSRIGVTGASGGGTQSFLLAAMDERIAVSVPVVMASAHMFGGCVCEAGLPIHQTDENPDGVLSNAEIAALAAPRPQLLVSVTWREDGGVRAGKHDQSCNTPAVEYPYLQQTYRLFGGAAAEARVENAHFYQDHDYGAAKRAVVYRFLAKHLGLDLSRAPRRLENPDAVDVDADVDDVDVDEGRFVSILPPRALRVWSRERPMPAHALRGHEAACSAFWGSGSGSSSGGSSSSQALE
jgi:hypothetical protein